MPYVKFVEGTDVKMKYVGIWVPPGLYARLKAVAEKEGRSLTKMLEMRLEWIANATEENGKPK